MIEKLTIKTLVSLVLADVDINLLLNEAQTADNDKTNFTNKEIRTQLESSCKRINLALTTIGYDVNKPLKTKNLNILES